MKRGTARTRTGRTVTWVEPSFDLGDTFTLRAETWTPPAGTPEPSPQPGPSLFDDGPG